MIKISFIIMKVKSLLHLLQKVYTILFSIIISRQMNQLAHLVSQLYVQYLPAQYKWSPSRRLNKKQAYQIYDKLKKRCLKCGGRIVAQGHGRSNGADRIEWEKRRTHVKCYKKAKKQNIFGCFQVEEIEREVGENPFQETIPATLEVFAATVAQ